MKITIVHGFFLPVPPIAGGAMEKSWWALAQCFACAGHDVVSISRRWGNRPTCESINGVTCLRVLGFNHTRSLARNLVLDARWGLSLLPQLPVADILITNTVFLPVIAPWLKPKAGRLVINLNRMPKGQLRCYHRVARLQVPSLAVADVVRMQCPRLHSVTKVFPNPIDLDRFANAGTPKSVGPIRMGYIGRIHPEKGLDLLIKAANALLQDPSLPPWTLELRGPSDIPHGGGGDDYLRRLMQLAQPLLSLRRLVISPPEFDPAKLAEHYRQLDVFVYPSLADQGETFGVAVAEAMAAGVVPVVSDLRCFNNMVVNGENGLVFSRHAADTPAQLTQALSSLCRAHEWRQRMARAAHARAQSYGVDRVARNMLDDFEQLCT